MRIYWKNNLEEGRLSFLQMDLKQELMMDSIRKGRFRQFIPNGIWRNGSISRQ